MNAQYEAFFDSSIELTQNEINKDALKEIPTSEGLLLFADSQNKPIQLLQAGNLRRLSQARLIPENSSPRRTDVSSLTKKIYWLSCYNHFMSQLFYIKLAHTVFGHDAVNWIQLPVPSFAVIDLDTPLPYFYASNNPKISEKRIVLGLFPNRKASSKFSEILNAAFYLCRNPSLVNSGKEKSCPYLQMQICPGPCLNSKLQNNYSNTVTQAIQTASGGIEQTLQQMTHQMQMSSQEMNFEKANETKKRLNQLKKLQRLNYHWVHNLKNLSILHVDKSFKRPIEGGKRKKLHYKWLKIVFDAVYDLGDFLPESPEQINHFLEQNWTTAPEISYTSSTHEHLGNLTYFLFRSKPPGFWLDCSNGIVAEQLHSGLDKFFNPKKSP